MKNSPQIWLLNLKYILNMEKYIYAFCKKCWNTKIIYLHFVVKEIVVKGTGPR